MRSLGAVLEALGVALDDALAVPLSCYSPDEVLVFECELQTLRARFDALCLQSAEAGHTLLAGMAGNHRSVADAVAANCSADPRQVRADQRLAHWVDGYPLFAQAAAAGVLTRRHVEALRRAENPRTREHLPEAQDYLIEAATGLSWREFTQTLRYWELAADPDGEEPEEQLVNRFCRIVINHDGTIRGSFQFDPIAGQAFTTAVAQHEQRLHRQDKDTGNNRNPSQRRADAVLELLLQGATRPDGTIPAPFLHIVLSHQLAETLLNENDAGDHPARRERLPIDAQDIDRRCELANGVPIHPRWALHTMATATLRRLVLTADSEATNLSRKVRSFPPHLKLALLAAARGRCRINGCDAPVPWLEADHVQPWNHHGETDITRNGQILCSHHNKLKRDSIPQKDPPRDDPPKQESPRSTEPDDG